jgi:hypothetical protein
MEGVQREMPTIKLRAALPAVLLVTCLGGFALAQFRIHPTAEKPALLPPPALAPNAVPVGAAEARPPAPAVEESKPVKAESARTAPAGSRRREAVIKVPSGTFVKDMDVGGYGSGRLTWTFEEDRVIGLIEANVMGVEVELRTEAEFSLSSTGTIYGIITHVELTHLKIGGGALGLLGEAGGIGEYVKLVKLAEPLLIEMLTDLPFSYQFRVNGNKLTILNFRTLLAGPNPLGKLGGIVGGGDSGLAVLSYFQAIGVAMEGTYTADGGENREKPKPIIRKPAGTNLPGAAPAR